MRPAGSPAVPLLLRPVAQVRRRIAAAPRGYVLRVACGVLAYIVAMRIGTGENRSEQLLVPAIMVSLAIWSDGTRRFLEGVLPFFLFGIVYDLTHITQPLFRHLHIHIAEPYAFDKVLFGIPTAQGRLTPNEFFALHHWPVADFFTGVAYIIFVYWPIAFAIYLVLFRRDPAGRSLLSHFGWTFLLMNVVGFATYYVYPAAPPWYVADHGFGPPDFSVQSSPAGAARWDALTGIPYFTGFYGRSADVFGAIPSLHVSYPLLTYLYARELGKRWFDVATFALFLLVCFAAVYLNHHYILDVLLGVLYTVVAWGIDGALRRRVPADYSDASSTSRMPSTGDGPSGEARAR